MKKIFEKELLILDTLFSEIVDTLGKKPESGDIEAARIYLENALALMNKWALGINQVKKYLADREPTADLSADNRPA